MGNDPWRSFKTGPLPDLSRPTKDELRRRIAALEAVVERQQRMLELAYFEGVHIHRAGQTLADATRLWLADLAARVEEDT
jgi:hypothetical protein